MSRWQAATPGAPPGKIDVALLQLSQRPQRQAAAVSEITFLSGTAQTTARKFGTAKGWYHLRLQLMSHGCRESLAKIPTQCPRRAIAALSRDTMGL